MRRGIVGIEAAIVLIAFVLVAAALAFVAINMGMFASQKSKEVMAKAYEASTRALETAGDAIAKVDTSSHKVVAVYIPIKLVAGATPVDLSKTVVSVLLQYPDSNGTSYAIAQAINTSAIAYGEISDLSEINDSSKANWYFTRPITGLKELLDPGEVAILFINITSIVGPSNIGLPAYSTIQVEIKPPNSAPLILRYTVPPTLASEYVDLVVG